MWYQIIIFFPFVTRTVLCNIISGRTPEIAEQRTLKLAFQSLCDFMLFIFIHSNFHVIRTLSYHLYFSVFHLLIWGLNKDFSHSTVSSFLSLKLIKLAGSGPVQYSWNIAESDVKHQKIQIQILWYFIRTLYGFFSERNTCFLAFLKFRHWIG